MSSDNDLLRQMQDITDQIKAQSADVTPDNLEAFLAHVSDSLNQVFALAQAEITKGLEHIETAQTCLDQENLGQEALALRTLMEKVQFAQNQLEIGQEVAQQKRDHDPSSQFAQKDQLMTQDLTNAFDELESED